MKNISLWSDEELADELIGALESMALQYLSNVDRDAMTRDFTMAGKRCLEILEALGKIRTDDGIHYIWTKGNEQILPED